MSKTDYAENKTLDWSTGRADPPASAGARFLALFTAAPSDTGGGTEVSTSGTAYARQAIASTDFAVAATGSTSNAVAKTFAAATAAYGPVTHWAIMDAATGGNMIRWAPVTTPKSYGVGDIPTFPIGQLVLTED